MKPSITAKGPCPWERGYSATKARSPVSARMRVSLPTLAQVSFMAQTLGDARTTETTRSLSTSMPDDTAGKLYRILPRSADKHQGMRTRVYV